MIFTNGFWESISGGLVLGSIIWRSSIITLFLLTLIMMGRSSIVPMVSRFANIVTIIVITVVVVNWLIALLPGPVKVVLYPITLVLGPVPIVPSITILLESVSIFTSITILVPCLLGFPISKMNDCDHPDEGDHGRARFGVPKRWLCD